MKKITKNTPADLERQTWSEIIRQKQGWKTDAGKKKKNKIVEL